MHYALNITYSCTLINIIICVWGKFEEEKYEFDEQF
jgi:hypothetical protein